MPFELPSPLPPGALGPVGQFQSAAALNPAAMEVMRVFEPTRHAVMIYASNALSLGAASGLTEAETLEVIRAYDEWYRSTPYPLSWDRVAEAIQARADGGRWTP